MICWYFLFILGDTSFQIKKSSYSKKIAKQLKRESMMEREAELKDVKIEIKQEPVDVDITQNVSEKDNKAEVEDRIKVKKLDTLPYMI